MIPQFKDLVTRYKPSVIFSDGEWDLSDTAWKSTEILAWLFNESPVATEVVVDDRWGGNTREKNTGATYTTSEYGSGMDATRIWEENQGIGHSYGYNRNEKLEDYKSGKELVLILADIVARGGNLLLDIGPTADGRIPVIMQERLTEMGDWLKINGEAIYGTTAMPEPYQWSAGKRPSKKEKSFMAGYSVAKLIVPNKDTAYIEAFFTKKGKDLYCILPKYVQEFRLRNRVLPAGSAVTILGSNFPVSFKNEKADCVINLSKVKPGDAAGELLVLKLKNVL
jgi:alpha-L-fucosidase